MRYPGYAVGQMAVYFSNPALTAAQVAILVVTGSKCVDLNHRILIVNVHQTKGLLVVFLLYSLDIFWVITCRIDIQDPKSNSA